MWATEIYDSIRRALVANMSAGRNDDLPRSGDGIDAGNAREALPGVCDTSGEHVAGADERKAVARLIVNTGRTLEEKLRAVGDSKA